MPENTVAVLPTSKTSKHAFKRGAGTTINGRFYPPGQDITIRRRGIPLGEGYVVTDFYTQGMSFKDDCWVAHLNLPYGGGSTNATLRASMFVLLSRFRSWDHVRILLPLWDRRATQADKDKVIDRFLKICELPANFKAELDRIAACAAATQETLNAFLRCCDLPPEAAVVPSAAAD